MRPLLLALPLLAAAASAHADTRPVRVAWTEVVVLDKSAKAGAELVNTLVAGEVVRGGRDVVSAGELSAVTGAAAALRACPGDACREAAHALRADYVLLASAAQLGRDFALELKLVDPAAGKVVAERTDVAARSRDIASVVQSSLKELFAGVPTSLEVLKQPAVTPDEAEVTPFPDPPPPPPAVVEPGPGRAPALAVLGGGAAAVVTGGVLVALALSFNAEKARLTWSEAQDRQRTARIRLYAGYALLGLGLAAAGVGAWLFLAPDAPKVALLPGPDGAVLAVSGRF